MKVISAQIDSPKSKVSRLGAKTAIGYNYFSSRDIFAKETPRHKNAHARGTEAIKNTGLSVKNFKNMKTKVQKISNFYVEI